MSSLLPSRASTDQLPPKPTPSLPARPAVSPLAVRSPSKSDPPLPSFHAPTNPPPPAHQDASPSAPPSHQLATIATGSTRIPMGERRKTAEDPTSPSSSGEPVSSSHGHTRGLGVALGGGEQLMDGTAKVDGAGASSRMGALGADSHGSDWSSPAASPRPGSVSRQSHTSASPSPALWSQHSPRPSQFGGGLDQASTPSQSTERPSYPRNPSTTTSSATARAQPTRTSPPFGYSGPFAGSTEAMYPYPTSSFGQASTTPYGWGYPSAEQLVYPIDSTTYSPTSGFQSPTMNPLSSPGQPYYDAHGYPTFASQPIQQQYYSSPAPGSAMSASVQPSLSSFGASGELSSQQTSSAADGSNGEIVYGSDGSPATSQEMFAFQQNQHLAAIQQQQRAVPPYLSYMPDPSATYPYGAPQGYGSPSFPPSAPQDFSGYQYPISSHSQQQPHLQQHAPSFSNLQQQQPTSPYFNAPPPLSPQQSHAQPPYTSPYRYYPPAPLPYGAYPSPVPPPPPFAGPGSPLSPPQVYSPPPELARGQLAQSKFHEAVFGAERDGGYSHAGPGGARDGRRGSGASFGVGGGAGLGGRALPKPPAHSPHALWVGNVPSDATHPELWRFFSSRPVPASSPKYSNLHPADIPAGVDLNSTGIESIHLISRSNCAFVNYASDIHLQHSIAVSNGLPLRPHDPRCKDLVCRVRKRDEDAKSGVGAQRIGGMHKDFVREKERERREEEKAEAAEGEKTEGSKEGPPQRYSTGSTTHSFSTTSTTSSFLAKHFERRFFVLKSHDEGDIKLSIERGLWATQLHNEPVLDQAFHTAKDVFLIFGANRAGAFAGYARMASAIHQSQKSGSSGENHISWTSRSSDEVPTSVGSLSSPSYSTGIPATIHEEDGTSTTNGLPRLFSPSEQRLAETSPLPITPGGTKLPSGSAPASLSPAARKEFSSEAERVAMEEAEFNLANLHLPDGVGRGESLDPKLLTRREGGGGDGVHQAVRQQQAVGASSKLGETDGDGVWRKDQLPTPAERNARLEKLGDGINGGDKSARDVSAEWGRPFRVEWIKVARLPFSRTRHIKNQFNSGKEVKISRDGTELEPSAGEALLNEFHNVDSDGNDNGDLKATPPTATPVGMGNSEDSTAQAIPSGLVSTRSSESS